MLAAEAALNDAGRADLAALLREVQAAERRRLELSLSLQALRAARSLRRFSWQQEPGGEDAADTGIGADSCSTCSMHGTHGHTSGHSCGSAASRPPPEPSKAEWEAAAAEAIKGLQECTMAINDAIGEVRQEVAELTA